MFMQNKFLVKFWEFFESQLINMMKPAYGRDLQNGFLNVPFTISM